MTQRAKRVYDRHRPPRGGLALLLKLRSHIRHNLTVPVITAAALLFAFPGVAGASHTSSGGSPFDFAAGGGTTFVGNHFGFGARSGPSGASGGMFVDGPGFSVSARVTCLAVDGNKATLIGERTGGTGAPLATGVAFFVENDSPEQFDFQFVTSILPAPPCVAFDPSSPISSGQIVVHDG